MNSASRQIIEALAKCGLCVSFSSLTHILCYDNINISTSIFVEQHSSAMARVQSGTFPIIYEVRNGNSEYMRLAPMLQRAHQASDLVFNADIRLSIDQISATQGQFKIHIIDILLKYCIHFKDYKHGSDSALQHTERRRLPKDLHRYCVLHQHKHDLSSRRMNGLGGRVVPVKGDGHCTWRVVLVILLDVDISH